MPATTLSPRRQSRIAVIEKYLASGLTQKQFCQQEQLAYATFHFWLKKYRQADAAASQAVSNSFVPLTFSSSIPNPGATDFIIEYPNGVTLRVSGTIAPQTLVHLIHSGGV